MDELVRSLWAAYKSMHRPHFANAERASSSLDNSSEHCESELWNNFIKFCIARDIDVGELQQFDTDHDVSMKINVSSERTSVEVCPADFECTICLKLLYKPTTTACGHSFCISCLEKALSFQQVCPVCRSVVYSLPQHLSVSTELHRLLEHTFPKEIRERESFLTSAALSTGNGAGVMPSSSSADIQTCSSSNITTREQQENTSYSSGDQGTVHRQSERPMQSLGHLESSASFERSEIGNAAQQSPSSTQHGTDSDTLRTDVSATNQNRSSEIDQQQSQFAQVSQSQETFPNETATLNLQRQEQQQHQEHIELYNRNMLTVPWGAVSPHHHEPFGEFAPLMSQERHLHSRMFLSCFVMRRPILPLQHLDLVMFEFRYISLASRVLAGSRRFGIICNWRDPDVGTEVEVTAFERIPGGRFHLHVVGRRSFKVESYAWSKEGYRICSVNYRDLTTNQEKNNVNYQDLTTNQAKNNPNYQDLTTNQAKNNANYQDLTTTNQEKNSVKAALHDMEQSIQELDHLLVAQGWVDESVLAQIKQSLGPKPCSKYPDKLLYWYAAYLNPVPAIGIAPEIRYKFLTLDTTDDRKKLLQLTISRAMCNCHPSAVWKMYKFLMEVQVVKAGMTKLSQYPIGVYLPFVIAIVSSILHGVMQQQDVGQVQEGV